MIDIFPKWVNVMTRLSQECPTGKRPMSRKLGLVIGLEKRSGQSIVWGRLLAEE
jgi:hypothetical protein